MRRTPLKCRLPDGDAYRQAHDPDMTHLIAPANCTDVVELISSAKE
jgi:hypothetical protein